VDDFDEVVEAHSAACYTVWLLLSFSSGHLHRN